MLAGSRVVVVAAPEDAVIVRPPQPGAPLADVRAAVVEALRFPLDGPPLGELLGGRSRATIVVDPPALPIPGSDPDPRRLGLTAVVEELERAGVPTGYQTILVAGGLARRAGQRELASLVTREFARRFHGHVTVHDVEDPRLVEVAEVGGRPVRANRALAETDAVVVVSAAESVLHGGPATLV